jgi:hypothetical protein
MDFFESLRQFGETSKQFGDMVCFPTIGIIVGVGLMVTYIAWMFDTFGKLKKEETWKTSPLEIDTNVFWDAFDNTLNGEVEEKPKRKNEQLLTDDGDVFEVIDAPDARRDVK